MERKYFASDFGGLSWSCWVPFTENAPLSSITSRPGLYRIRAEKCAELVYLGQTGVNLRQRLKKLQKGTFSTSMPFNDPHTAAPNLWVWRQEGIGEYECSVVELECDYQTRQVMEDYLLWLCRTEAGRSTLCNHGNFHHNYIKSSNKQQGRVGAKIEHILPSTTDYYSRGHKPLEYKPHALSSDWMNLKWSLTNKLLPELIANIKDCNGVYRLFCPESNQLVYIGESSQLKKRLLAHYKSSLTEFASGLLFSYVYLGAETTSVNRHEIEVDLIGGFYHQYRTPPLRQYNLTKK